MAPSKHLKPWRFLREARLRAGHTPTTAAIELDVSLTHYCSVEAGRRGFSDEKLILASRIFNVDVAELDRTQPRPNRTELATGAIAS